MTLPKLTKVDLPPSSFPLPRSLFLFTCASLLGSCLLFIISMLDLGYLSMWVNPCASIITVIYHIGVILIARRKRVPNAPSYFSTAIFSAYLMALVWFIGFILTLVVLVSGPGNAFKVVGLGQGAANVYTERAQIFLTLYELLVVGGMAVTGHAIVRKEGPDPEAWRNLETGEVCGASLCSIFEYKVDHSSGCCCRTSDDRGYEMMDDRHLLKPC
jgi:hypothetical protein